MPQRVGYCEIQKEYVPLHQQTQGDLSLWSGNVATLIADALMVIIAQLVRASDCGSEGRGFESHWSPYSFARFFLFSVLASLFRSVFDYNFLFEVAKTFVLATFFFVEGGERAALSSSMLVL